MEDRKKSYAEMRRLARESAPTRWSRKELSQIALLRGAHQETIAPILADCPVKVLSAGEVLLRAGEACHALYLVLSGKLKLEDPSFTFPDTVIRAGDCIGELFLMEKAVVAATVSATEPARLLVVDRNAALALVRVSHEIARNWLSLFAERTHVSGVIAGTEELKTSHGHQQTTHDRPTGLHSRNWLESMLPREVARTATAGVPLGLLIIEIDRYGDYVARFGADAGEDACREVAAKLATNFRPTDIIAAYGIGQFAVVLPSADIASTCQAGERLRQAINRPRDYEPNETPLPMLTVSIGATQLRPADDALALLAAAEAALEMAKSRGGNRVGMS